MGKMILLVLSSIILAIGGCGSPLVMRLYFVNGGTDIWLSAFLQNCGWPVILIPIVISYFLRRRTEGPNTKLILMQVPMFLGTIFLGVILGLSTFTYAIGVDFLPVTTLTLVYSTQLAFTAVFAFLIVKQKFTVFSIAAVIFLVAGAAVLALDGGQNTTEGESTERYILGFVLTAVAAALTGLNLPLIELVYAKSKQEMSYTLIMEMQTMITIFATVVAAIGMLVTNGFKTIPSEARTFKLGEANFYLVIVSAAIAFQCLSLGNVGVIFSASALLAGIMGAVLVPVSEVLAVIFLHEDFTVGKGVSLTLCLLGFASYYYGEIKQSKEQNLTNEEASQMLLHDT